MLLVVLLLSSCESSPKAKTSDTKQAEETEAVMNEMNRQVGMPAMVNFQEKKLLKWIFELRDQADLVTYTYLVNEMNGTVGQFLGQSIGYGIPAATQFTNPYKLGTVDGGDMGARNPFLLPQADPNGLFMPVSTSATWVILINPETGNPMPVYLEPLLIVSPFKLH